MGREKMAGLMVVDDVGVGVPRPKTSFAATAAAAAASASRAGVVAAVGRNGAGVVGTACGRRV